MKAIIQSIAIERGHSADLIRICRKLDSWGFEIEVVSPLSFDHRTGMARIIPIMLRDGVILCGRGREDVPSCDLYLFRGNGIVKEEPWSRMIGRFNLQYALVQRWIDAGAIKYCLNTPAAQARAQDKSHLYELEGVPLPKRFEPRSMSEVLRLVRSEGALIRKPRFGSQGHGVGLLRSTDNEEDLRRKLHDPFDDALDVWLFQRFVPDVLKEGTRRLLMVGGELACAARYVGTGFLTNIHQGGTMSPYSPTEKEVEIAGSCVRSMEIDFGSVDFIGPYVLEVNGSAVGMRTLTILSEELNRDLSLPLRDLILKNIRG